MLIRHYKNNATMKNQDIIKKAQAECGEYVTGYRYDITAESIIAICRMVWNRSVNLSFTFCEFRMEMNKVIGIRAYNYWLVNILDFIQSKMNDGNYFCHHGEKYCA